jgi:hypothetical protein
LQPIDRADDLQISKRVVLSRRCHQTCGRLKKSGSHASVLLEKLADESCPV